MHSTRDLNPVPESNSSPYLFSVSCFLPRIWSTPKSVFVFLATPYHSFSGVSIQMFPWNILHVTPTVSSYNASNAVLKLSYTADSWRNFKCFRNKISETTLYVCDTCPVANYRTDFVQNQYLGNHVLNNVEQCWFWFGLVHFNTSKLSGNYIFHLL
jgi:hypothetical protein